MPLLHHAMIGPFAGDREAVKLARQADREIADVDHLLHLATAFRDDLAGFDGDQAAQCILGGAQFMAEQANQFAALRWRNLAPLPECRFSQRNGFGYTLRTCILEMGDGLAGQRRAYGARAMPAIGGDSEMIEQECNFAGEHGGFSRSLLVGGDGSRMLRHLKTILKAARPFRRYAAKKNYFASSLRSLCRGGHRARHQFVQTVLAHQYVERCGRSAAGRGDVLAQRRGVEIGSMQQFA